MISFEDSKNRKLKKDRGFDFDDLIKEYEKGNLIDVLPHPTRKNQVLLIFRINDYIICSPAVQTKKGWFLKTAYKSRKHNKIYGDKK